MSGWPLRVARATFGPTLEDERPVTNPQRQVSAQSLNLAFWQLGGLSAVSHRAIVAMQIAVGPDIAVVGQGLAWDPNNALALLDADRNALGDYQLDFAATYPDENAVAQTLNLLWGEASVMGANDKRADVVRTTGVSFRLIVRTGATGALVELAVDETLLVKFW